VSQTWHAILAGREALQSGLLIESIWNDWWISNHFGGKLIVVPDNPQVNMVADLITPSGGWNEEQLVK